MVKVDYDIDQFSGFLKVQCEALTLQGKSNTGLLTNLFIAYDKVIDFVNRAYLTNHQDGYVDSMANFTEDGLMEVAVNKYKISIKVETWNTPSAHDSQINTLTAEIDAINNNESKTTPYENKKKTSNCQNNADIAWKKVSQKTRNRTKNSG